jgi:NitT/TauT family transport system substrate-binding protein
VLVLAAPALLALAACGGGSSSSAAQSSAQTSAQTSAADSAAASSPSGGGAPATEASIQVAYIPIYTAGILTIADKQGFFAEQKLKVELVPVANPPAAVAAISGGQVAFGYAPSIPLLRAAANGVDVKVAAPADGYEKGAGADTANAKLLDDTAVVARKGSGVTTAKDLEGKTVSVPARGAQLEVTISSAVKEAGGDPTKVKWVALGLPEAVAALKAGRIDAAGLVSPFIATAVKDGGTVVSYPGVSFFQEGAVGLWLTSGKYDTANHDVVTRFATAIKKANAYATDHLPEFQQAAADITKTPLAEVQAGTKPFFPQEVADSDLKLVVDKMVATGFLKKDVDVTTLVIH